MTRKDIELIAKAMASVAISAPTKPAASASEHFNEGYTSGLKWAAESLADALELDNPRFDRERFLTACGVQS